MVLGSLVPEGLQLDSSPLLSGAGQISAQHANWVNMTSFSIGDGDETAVRGVGWAADAGCAQPLQTLTRHRLHSLRHGLAQNSAGVMDAVSRQRTPKQTPHQPML